MDRQYGLIGLAIWMAEEKVFPFLPIINVFQVQIKVIISGAGLYHCQPTRPERWSCHGILCHPHPPGLILSRLLKLAAVISIDKIKMHSNQSL